MEKFSPEFFQKTGAMGGKKTAENSTPAERIARARAAAKARWARAAKQKAEASKS